MSEEQLRIGAFSTAVLAIENPDLQIEFSFDKPYHSGIMILFAISFLWKLNGTMALH